MFIMAEQINPDAYSVLGAFEKIYRSVLEQ